MNKKLITYQTTDIGGPCEGTMWVEESTWDIIQRMFRSPLMPFRVKRGDTMEITSIDGTTRKALVESVDPDYTGDDYLKVKVVLSYYNDGNTYHK